MKRVPRNNTEEGEAIPAERGYPCTGAWIHDHAGVDGMGDEGGASGDTGV